MSLSPRIAFNRHGVWAIYKFEVARSLRTLVQSLVTPVLTTSLFPEHVRGRAIGIVYHTGAFIGAGAPIAITALAKETQLTLSSSIMIVVGAALVGMSAAVIALRHRITMPAAAAMHDAKASVELEADRAVAAIPLPPTSPTNLPPPDAFGRIDTTPTPRVAL